ncbi:hypothetical protein [Bacillus norwichensis]|uniref:Lipoprotein n=1 Tax=Bacillus norwichensis TaxID=2762217 RepID=A0ABR8VNS6_9BACI|nr:hypothetical protein [Bacillus norwichensis]MBD8006418.1 hypothetical protein [Bacillus norwichensis]
MRSLKFLAIFILFWGLIGCSNKASGKSEYRADLQSVVDDIMDNAANAENMVSTYADLWSFSINKSGQMKIQDIADKLNLSKSEVIDYFEILEFTDVVIGGYSGNIRSLNKYYTETGKIEELEDASNEIQNKIKKLNNPPEEYVKVYDKVVELYTLAEELKEMAISPNGSLVTFNQQRGQLSNDIVSKYKEIEVILPNEND